jgi:hypothetical protein
MSPAQKKTAMVVVGVVVAGAIISSSSGGDSVGPNCQIAVGPNGSDHIC